MKYSVVIPLYNKEHYIVHTLESVLAQSFQDFEIIVVDDGSTDQSAQMASGVISDKIKIIRQENQGVSVARNTGIEYATGEYIAFLDADVICIKEYIAFLDADDVWKENYLETIDRLTKAYPQSDFYVTSYRVVMGDGKYHYSSRLEPEEGCLESYWLTYQYPYDFVWTSATVIKKKAVLQAGGFRPGEKIGQDLDLWARVARNNPRVAYSARICVDYNRKAEANARSRVKIAWAGALLRDLEEELVNPERSAEELVMIKHKYDLKMTVYVFTCILCGDKHRAQNAMKDWRGRNTWKTVLLKTGLGIGMIMPSSVNRFLYFIRLKVF